MSKKWMATLALVLALGACKKDDAGETPQTSNTEPADNTSATTPSDTTAKEPSETSPAADTPAKKPLERKKVDVAKAKKQSESFRALLAKGRKEVKSGKFADGVASFEKALEIDPNNAGAWNNRGIARKDKGDLDGAIADYSRAIQIDSNDAAVVAAGELDRYGSRSRRHVKHPISRTRSGPGDEEASPPRILSKTQQFCQVCPLFFQ